MLNGETILVRWIQYATQEEITKACTVPKPITAGMPAGGIALMNFVARSRLSDADAPVFNGCYRREGNTCVIVTGKLTDASAERMYQTVGHELRHCYEGRFH